MRAARRGCRPHLVKCRQSGCGHLVGYAVVVRRVAWSACSARYESAKQERADCRQHERQDGQCRSDYANDGQREADDADRPRDAASDSKSVRTPLPHPSRGIAAALL